MAAAPGPRLTTAQGRRFALTLALGFAAVGALLRWRGAPGAALVPWGLAALLLLAGLVVPTRLGPVERGWMAFGVALSRVTTPVFYSTLYFLVLTPTALLRRTFGRSPLARDPAAPTYWVDRPPPEPEAARRALEHQF
jgi:hypothetical protein